MPMKITVQINFSKIWLYDYSINSLKVSFLLHRYFIFCRFYQKFINTKKKQIIPVVIKIEDIS